MPNEDAVKLAEQVQAVSELWHCASAIYAVETLLKISLKDEYEDKIGSGTI